MEPKCRTQKLPAAKSGKVRSSYEDRRTGVSMDPYPYSSKRLTFLAGDICALPMNKITETKEPPYHRSN